MKFSRGLVQCTCFMTSIYILVLEIIYTSVYKNNCFFFKENVMLFLHLAHISPFSLTSSKYLHTMMLVECGCSCFLKYFSLKNVSK